MGTPNTTPNPAQGMTFDSAPVTQATPVSSAPSPGPSGGGMTFDASPVSSPITVTTPAAQPKQTAPKASIQATEQPTGVMDHIQQWANNVADDIRYGTNRTGIGTLLKDMGASGVYSGNDPRVGDFLASLPLGALKMIKGTAELPQSGKRWQGIKDAAGGALQAATVPGGFIAPEAAEAAPEVAAKAGDALANAASKAGSAVAEQTGKTVNAIRKPFSLKAVQEALQNSKESIQQELADTLANVQGNFHGAVRDLFDQVAQEAGVKPKPAESLHDVAANTAAAIKSKASSLYKQLDQAVGGTRFQTWDEQLSNVKRALRNSAGIDPDADGRLVERINAIEDAKAKALEQAKAAGVNPNLIHEANATHRQAMALEDLSKHIRASMSGLRADVAQGVNAAPEALSPAKLAPRANRLYNTGRLAQAVGEDRADDLLRAIETTKQQAKDAAANAVKQSEGAADTAARKTAAVRRAQAIAASGAGTVGVGSAWAWLRHLLGE